MNTGTINRSLPLTAVMILITCLSANAQMLWPIAGAEAGEGIIYKPQQYLELNFNCQCNTGESQS